MRLLETVFLPIINQLESQLQLRSIIPPSAQEVLYFHIRTLLKSLLRDSPEPLLLYHRFLNSNPALQETDRTSQISDRLVTDIKGNLKQGVSLERGTSRPRNTSEVGQVVSWNEETVHVYTANVLYAAAFHTVIHICRYIGGEDHPHHGVYCLRWEAQDWTANELEKGHEGDIKYGQGAVWTLEKKMTKLLQFKRKGLPRPRLIRSANQIFLLFSHLSILAPADLDFLVLNSLLWLLRSKLNKAFP